MRGPGVCAKLVQNMINDSCHHLFSELQHAEFKEAFNEFDKVRIYIFYYTSISQTLILILIIIRMYLELGEAP